MPSDAAPRRTSFMYADSFSPNFFIFKTNTKWVWITFTPSNIDAEIIVNTKKKLATEPFSTS